MDRTGFDMPISDLLGEAFVSSQVFRARIFQRDARAKTPGGLTVVCGGCEHCAADYAIDRRGFPFWCVEFVAAGLAEVTLANEKPETMVPGSVFIYGSKTAYRMRSDPGHPLVKYFVDFHGPRAAPLLRSLGLTAGGVSMVFPPGPVAEAFDRMIDAGLDSSPRAARRTSLLLEALLLSCADLRVLVRGMDTGAFATYRRCRTLIDGLNPAGPVIRTVAATARACGIDSAYLCRLFQQFAGTSPYHYLSRRRMEAATARLSKPGTSVKEVAEELGFADPYHFSRVFKRFHGVPPVSFLRRQG